MDTQKWEYYSYNSRWFQNCPSEHCPLFRHYSYSCNERWPLQPVSFWEVTIGNHCSFSSTGSSEAQLNLLGGREGSQSHKKFQNVYELFNNKYFFKNYCLFGNRYKKKKLASYFLKFPSITTLFHFSFFARKLRWPVNI